MLSSRPTRVSAGPDAFSASRVLAKVAGERLSAITATSDCFSAIAASSAGMKCSVFNWSNAGAAPCGPDQAAKTGLSARDMQHSWRGRALMYARRDATSRPSFVQRARRPLRHGADAPRHLPRSATLHGAGAGLLRSCPATAGEVADRKAG